MKDYKHTIKEYHIKQFLEFRKLFTQGEWYRVNEAVERIEKEKAAQMRLNDLDVAKAFEIIKNNMLTFN